MKTYLMLSRLTIEGRKAVNESPKRIVIENKFLETKGVKVVSQYALLGPYDFVTILETEDHVDIFHIVTEINSHGKVETQTFPALTVDAFIQSVVDGP